MLTSYKELVLWQRSIALVSEVYRATKQFPKDEMFALTSQMRRAAVSIPSNIAEGSQRNNTKEYIQFLGIARGSLAELETQIVIAKEQYPDVLFAIAEALILEIQKMSGRLISQLRLRHSTLNTQH